jgi:enoyl-CoA hydratase/carnithine racemase
MRDATGAERLGLVSRVVPDHELETAVRALAQDVLRTRRLASGSRRSCLHMSLGAGSRFPLRPRPGVIGRPRFATFPRVL